MASKAQMGKEFMAGLQTSIDASMAFAKKHPKHLQKQTLLKGSEL
jgi:hypothetical protein